MRAQDEEVGFLPLVQFGKALVVGLYLLAIEGKQGFLGAQDEWDVGLPVDRAGVVERVAAVKDPAVSGIHGDGGVASGVAWHRDQDYSGTDVVEGLRGGEAAPCFAVGGVFDEVWPVRPLWFAVPQFLACRWIVDGAESFCGSDVDLGVREVRDSADVIKVEMGDDDVAHVLRAEAESLDVVRGGLDVEQPRPDDVPERPDPPGGVVAVVGSESGVHEYETVVGFDEQDVADHRRCRHPHRAAVKVVHLHDWWLASPSVVTSNVLRKLHTSW